MAIKTKGVKEVQSGNQGQKCQNGNQGCSNDYLSKNQNILYCTKNYLFIFKKKYEFGLKYESFVH